MSDPVKKVNWFVAGVRFVFVNLWAFVTTEGKTVKEWNLDPMKVIGIMLFLVAAWLAFQAVHFVEIGKSDAAIAVIGGLVVPVGGFGAFLFNQATGNDEAIRRRFDNKSDPVGQP